jgi:glycosyltransferase involved in cell wall biosynthesis
MRQTAEGTDGAYPFSMRIVQITPGAAGMFCGSCMKDNALAAALINLGHDCLLIPTFTPLTLDEPDNSARPVYLGGINVYMDEFAAFRWMPHWTRRWLDSPRVLGWASRFSGIENYEKLGALTLSMLQGDRGRQRREFAQLVRYLSDNVRPDVVILSNVLLSALGPLISGRLGIPVIATLQGDDIFLDSLHESDRQQAIELIRENGKAMAGYIATSRYYADHMAVYLGLPIDRIQVVLPGINVRNYLPGPKPTGPPVVGYFARIAPEKGLHLLADAFIRLKQTSECKNVRMQISGWLGKQHRPYLDKTLNDIQTAGFGADVTHKSCPTLRDKIGFLQSLSVLSVPTMYREPKALYALEAMANGVPIVVPNHGVFPELIGPTEGGQLVPPHDVPALAESLRQLICQPQRMAEIGQRARAGVQKHFSDQRMATDTIAAVEKLLGRNSL